MVATLLYLKANPKADAQSRTFQLSEHFIEAYRLAHPKDSVITLDLYREEIRPLTAEEVALTHRCEDQDHRMLRYARQFHDADKYAVAAPLWNLGIPSILKAYIDYIMIVGITFRYTEQGPRGLCVGKKAVHLTSRGGNYTEGPYAAYEMGDRYLRAVFGFLGITDFTTIAAQGLDIVGADVPAIMAKAKAEAEESAKGF